MLSSNHRAGQAVCLLQFGYGTMGWPGSDCGCMLVIGLLPVLDRNGSAPASLLAGDAMTGL